uniref:Uncharacterized protein n=1 Tax=Magallana gigas TaxID=29159 RepID=A0A8W8LD84_MAGGI
ICKMSAVKRKQLFHRFLAISKISDSISVNKFYATLSDDRKEKIANGPELGDFIHDNPQVNAENI